MSLEVQFCINELKNREKKIFKVFGPIFRSICQNDLSCVYILFTFFHHLVNVINTRKKYKKNYILYVEHLFCYR